MIHHGFPMIALQLDLFRAQCHQPSHPRYEDRLKETCLISSGRPSGGSFLVEEISLCKAGRPES